MKIFVSMPITGFEDTAPERAKCAKEWLNTYFKDKDSFEIITPYDFEHKDMTNVATSMGECIEMLLTCDMVIFLSGYEKSKGCSLEHSAATIYGKDIRYLSDKNIIPILRG